MLADDETLEKIMTQLRELYLDQIIEIGHDGMKTWVKMCKQSFVFYKLARQEITID